MPTKAGQRDVFPTTQRTWIGRQLAGADAGRGAALEHVMEVYAAPLAVYCRGCSLRWLGDPDDLVRGFFADRLSRPAFLDRWLQSGRPLRYWLIVGFKHFLLEQARARRRERGPAEPERLEAAGSAADQEFDRACAQSLVRTALTAAHDACRHADQLDHWTIFRAHFVEGMDYAQVAAQHGVDRRRAAVMARTAATKFKSALRDAIGWEAASAEEIDSEIRSLMEALES